MATKSKKTAKNAAAKKGTAKRITAAKAAAVKAAKANAKKNGGPKAGSKTEQLMALLAGKGSTVEAMTKALGWQPHTLRAALTRLPGGAKAERSRVDDVTSYRIA